jgi:hypothetical protein
MISTRMRSAISVLAAAALLVAGATRAAAQQDSRAALAAERARVHTELNRVNADIDRLKREGHGIGDDYRLRSRLADAEALARRLTTLDAQLGGARPPPPPEAAAHANAEPAAAPSDGPAELEAKADILADQARRLGAQAAALEQRAGALKARQDLRRRVGQMERDPFSPLEGAKRHTIAATTQSTANPSSNGSFSAGHTSTGDSPQQPAVTPNGIVGPSGPGSTVSTPGAGAGGRVQVSTPTPPSPSTSTGGSDTLSVQLRDLLDPTALAEIRKLEASRAPGADLQALERAAAAVRARADRLAAESRTLRARGKAVPK